MKNSLKETFHQLGFLCSKEFCLAFIVFLLAASSTYVTWLFSLNMTLSLGWLPVLILILGIAFDLLLFILLFTLSLSYSRARDTVLTMHNTLEKGEKNIEKKEKEIDNAKDEFVSLASHQLRTPLSTINWYTEMLLAGDAGKLTREQKKYINQIYHSSTRMTELVSALLNISRIELASFAIEPRMTKLKPFIEGILKEFYPILQYKKMRVKKTFDTRLLPLPVDEKLLHIVIENIISNAIHYTPDNGAITIEVQKNAAEILLKITDTGYGIPKSQHDKIFTKLFRADNVRERDTTGNGLGLHIVKSILEQAGCEIWFESEENTGTTFFVSIPERGMKQRDGARVLA